MGNGDRIGRSKNSPHIKRAADVVKKSFNNETWASVRPFYSMAGERFRNKLGGTAAARAAFALGIGGVHWEAKAAGIISTLTELEGRGVVVWHLFAKVG